MNAILSQIYNKHAPRWFKVIRWREYAERTLANQKEMFFIFYAPMYVIFFHNDHPYATWLFFKRPKTDEERLELKRECNTSVFQRNWDIDMYEHDVPPMYDLAVRRQKYPQYYEGRYDGHKRFDV